jgi:23S rRNA pseudouridine2605 synthase
VNPELLSPLTAGILDAGERLRARRCRILRSGQGHSLVEVELTEGKNREVRRLFEAIGLRVERLQRTRVGSLKLGELPVGKWRSLTSTEIAGLLAATPPATDPRAARTPKRPSSS